MTDTLLIEAPGGFVPLAAMSFGVRETPPFTVHDGNLLSVRDPLAPSGAISFVGTTNVSGVLGRYTPELRCRLR